MLGELALLFVPGEYFTEFGLEIKRRSPFAHTFVVESLGESLGYIPTRKAYEEGGYQPAVGTRVAPGGGELIMEQALALLEESVGKRLYMICLKRTSSARIRLTSEATSASPPAPRSERKLTLSQ